MRVATARELHERLKEQTASAVPHPVLAVLGRLHAAGFSAYLAGGCVRDLAMDRIPEDFDVATSARPEQVIPLFPKVVPTGVKHGTVTVVTEGRHVEVTTYRGEGSYLDGRRPETVHFLDDVEADLARRDFTVNAIAWDPVQGDLRDPFGGVGDVARRRIRAVRDPMERFSEDGLRPLRAVRLASVLSFGLDGATREAIGATLDTFRKVAVERVRDELVKLLLRSPKPSRGLELLADTGLLAGFLPELLEGRTLVQNRFHRWPVWAHVMRVVDHAPARLEVRLAALLHDVAKPVTAVEIEPGEHSFHKHEHVGAEMTKAILERLKFPNKVVEHVSHLVREHNWFYAPEWTDGTVRRHLARVGTESLTDFFDLREADLKGRGRGVQAGLKNLEALRRRFDAEREKAHALTIGDLAIDGRRLMSKLGMTPGPAVGETLRALLQHVLDHPEDNTEERLLELARPRAVEP